jgi:hypothetical protein
VLICLLGLSKPPRRLGLRQQADCQVSPDEFRRRAAAAWDIYEAKVSCNSFAGRGSPPAPLLSQRLTHECACARQASGRFKADMLRGLNDRLGTAYDSTYRRCEHVCPKHGRRCRLNVMAHDEHICDTLTVRCVATLSAFARSRCASGGL